MISLEGSLKVSENRLQKIPFLWVSALVLVVWVCLRGLWVVRVAWLAGDGLEIEGLVEDSGGSICDNVMKVIEKSK